MPCVCQTIICSNRKGDIRKKGFFRFPDPSKSAASKKPCSLWIDRLRNASLDINQFIRDKRYHKNKYVWEDHFCKSDFVGTFLIDIKPLTVSLGNLPRKSSTQHDKKRRNAQVRSIIFFFKKKYSHSFSIFLPKISTSKCFIHSLLLFNWWLSLILLINQRIKGTKISSHFSILCTSQVFVCSFFLNGTS